MHNIAVLNMNLINAPNDIIYNDSLDMVILRSHCVISVPRIPIGSVGCWLMVIVTLVHICCSAIG